MIASNKLTETDQLISDGDLPLDPFAVDIFGVKNQSAELVIPEEVRTFKPKPKRVKNSDWAKNLPFLTVQDVEFSYNLQSIPEKLTEQAVKILTESIARYTFRQTKEVNFSIISTTETNLNEAIGKIKNSPKVFFTVASQPKNITAVIAVNTDFASSIIDLILGGKGSQLNHLQGLSPIEKAIMQFLTLNILQEINNFSGVQMLSLQNISHDLELSFLPNERGAEIVANLELEEYSGIISLIAPQKFLQTLEQTQNPLFGRQSGRKRLNYLEKLIPGLDLRLQLGTTFLDSESLLFLERDDIVLLEKPEISWQAGKFNDKLQVCVGQGNNFRLQGTIDETNSIEQIYFKIEEILSEETRRKFKPAKFKMDEKETDRAEETNVEISDQIGATEDNEREISASLENIQVALRVEIAGNKISLRELQNLHNGQVIALGCSPTDPVRLVTDNNPEPIASGELVEVEGQLGVRLTKVFI